MKHLITSALPYVNGTKHLGNLIGSLLPSDIYARYLRQCGEEVLFVCGTDDYGSPSEIAAQGLGIETDEYCDQMYQVQSAQYEQLDISFDYFGYTSTEEHTRVVQEAFLKLDEAGCIVEKPVSQFYSEVDARYLSDRYIEGTCPKCGYEQARGDQCDGCGSLLNPEDLINPRSVLSGDTDLKLVTQNHLFLKLDDFIEPLSQWLSETDWDATTRGIIKKWLTEGVEDRCITRNQKWGVPVPKAGYEDLVFYVWFDAPYGYVSISQVWARLNGKQWEDWWTGDDVRYTQFMGKDNLPFHTIFWPGVLIALGQPINLVSKIKSFNWLFYDNGKFSTSQQRGVFVDTALELYPVDYWRYFLVARAPESADSNFSFEEMAAVVNSELANNLGNFSNRVLKLATRLFAEGNRFEISADTLPDDLNRELREQVGRLSEAYDSMEFRKINAELRDTWGIGNKYISNEKPWELDDDAAAVVIRNCLYLLAVSAAVARPVIPHTASKILELAGVDEAATNSRFDELLSKPLQLFYTPAPKANLFKKISEEEVAALVEKFGGSDG